MPERYEVETVKASEIGKGDRVWWQSEEEWATVSADPCTYRQFGDRGPTLIKIVLGGDPTNWQPDEFVPRVVAARGGTEDELREALRELVEAIGMDHGKRSESEHRRQAVKRTRVAAAIERANAAPAARAATPEEEE